MVGIWWGWYQDTFFSVSVSMESALRVRCEQSTCSKAYKSMGWLRRHQSRHTHNGKFYRCTHAGCNKSFDRSWVLRVHMRIHTNTKPYKCPYGTCDAAFSQSNGLMIHMRCHTGERPYRCPHCPSSFKTVTPFKYHVGTHISREARGSGHGGEAQEAQEPK